MVGNGERERENEEAVEVEPAFMVRQSLARRRRHLRAKCRERKE